MAPSGCSALHGGVNPNENNNNNNKNSTFTLVIEYIPCLFVLQYVELKVS